MASVFMFSLSAIWWRTRSMPAWLPMITVLTGLALLLVTTQSLWLAILFPVGVLFISLYILPREVQAILQL